MSLWLSRTSVAEARRVRQTDKVNAVREKHETTITMAESLRFLGSLTGHSGWVTAIATSSETPDVILTASRGNTILCRVCASFRLNTILLPRQDHHRVATHS